MKVLAVIPARGGSKSIPLKNIKPLNGKPLIEYTIETALESEVLDRIAVSTDHDKIKKVCKNFEGIHIIHRPAELATDEATTECALLQVCDELEHIDGFLPDVVMTLEPTSPLRTPETIRRCVDIFTTTEADSVIGVEELSHYPGVITNGRYKFLINNSRRRRQEREPVYMESSTIYGTKLSSLKKNNSVIGEKLYALIIKKNEAVDINDLWDFNYAALLMQLNNK